MNGLCALFEQMKPLSAGLRTGLEEVVHARYYPQDQFLCMPDSTPDYLFFIVRGIVETYFFNSGRIVIAAFTGPDEVCFEPGCLFEPASVKHGVIALADTEVLCLSYGSIRRLLMHFPEFAYHLQRLIGIRDQYYDRRIELLSEPTDVRLEHFIELYERHFHGVTRAHVSQFLNMSVSHLYTLLQRQRKAYHNKRKKAMNV